MKNKYVISLFAALALSCSAIPMSTFATGEDSNVEPLTDVVEDNTESSENSEEIDWQGLKDAYTEDFLANTENLEEDDVQSTTKDYYADEYYDTDGNATLIDSQVYDVIYSGESLLFTSVTTKDGHVFYVLVNYADEDGEDNVYFLNKVDDYDLYSLLYAGSGDDESSTANQIAQYEQQTTAKTDKKNDNKTTETTASEAETETQTSQSNKNMIRLMIGGGLVLLLGIGIFVVPKLLNSGKKKNEVIIEDDDLDEFSEE